MNDKSTPDSVPADDSRRSLAIIIPFHREGGDLIECLESLRAAGDLDSAQVILVDDASGDDTGRRALERFPQVTLARREVNGGFAAAANTGLARVLPDRRFIALLNSDTLVQPRWSQHAIEALCANDRVAAIAPRVLLHHAPEKLDSAGQSYTRSGWAFRRGHGRPADQFNRAEEVFSAAGCAMILRRDALEGHHLFDEQLVCYYEDIDLSFRLRRGGWTTFHEPRSVVRHKVSSSYKRLPATKVFHVSRNIELIYWRYLPAHRRWRSLFLHALLILAQGAQKLLQGQFGPYLRGKWDAGVILWNARREDRVSPSASVTGTTR